MDIHTQTAFSWLRVLASLISIVKLQNKLGIVR